MAVSNRLIVIQGPTASGKTSLSIALAQHFQTEIISADSRQFYKELNIGVAKPSIAELEIVPHHFIGNETIEHLITCAKFEKLGLELLHNLFQKHSTVILVGGSGMFIDALVNGLDEIPTDESLRNKLIERQKNEGFSILVQELVNLDKDAVNHLDMNNPSRVLRALEVLMITGKPIRSFKKFQPQKRFFDAYRFAINLPREILYERINHRVDLMIQEGLLDEVKDLLPFRHLKTLQTVGYQELFPYFDGNISLDEAIENIKQNSRRYAKRQMTWLRRTKDINWLEGQNLTTQVNEILKIVE